MLREHCRRNFLLVGRSIHMEECPLAIYQNQNMKKALVFYSKSRKHSICFPFFPTTVLQTKLQTVYSRLSLFSLKLHYLLQWFSPRQYSKTPCFLIGPLEQLQNQALHHFVDRQKQLQRRRITALYKGNTRIHQQSLVTHPPRFRSMPHSSHFQILFL